MGLVMPAILQLLNLCVIGFALALQGSTGLNLSPSPEPLPANPPIEIAPGPLPYSKSLTSNVPSPALQPNGSALHPAPAMPPDNSVPVAPEIKGQVPSMSPSTPTVLPPFSTARPPLNIQGHIPSTPPTATQGKPPVNKSPVSVPVAPVPVGTPSRNLPQISPAIHSSTPETSPLRAYQRNAPDNKVPTQEPITPDTAPASSLPKTLGPIPSVVHSISPNIAPTILPVPVASPTSKMPQNSSSIHPARPGESPSTLPDPEVSPVSSPPPSINWKRDQIPVVAPPYESPKPSLPMGHSPAKAPSVQKPVVSSPSPSTNWKRDQMPVVAPPYEAPKASVPMAHTPAKALSVHKPDVPSSPLSIKWKRGQIPVAAPPYEAPKPSLPMGNAPAKAPSAHKPVVSSPSPSTNWKKGRMPVVAPPYEAPKPSLPMGHTPAKAPSAHKPVVSSPSPSTVWKRGRMPVAAPPYEAPKPSLPMAHTPAKAPSVHKPDVPSSPPSIKWKRGQIPVAAPPYEAPKPSLPIGHTPAKAPSVHRPLRHYNLAPEPSNSSPEPPFNKGYRSPASSPASSPPSSFYMHHHSRNKITNPAPAPSYLLSPSTSKQQGPVIPPASFRAGRQRNFAPPPLNPGPSVPPSHVHVTPSVSHVSPAPSPSLKDASDYARRSSSKSPKVPPLPPVQAFPPPPPNADCSTTICTEPYTNTPPGSPCACVLPMQVGLRISVALYTFFPLVSELAQEIAVGVFMEQSQVRIIGANAANQQPEKTVVLIDLVPMGEKFDNTTAFLTHQRFWHKKVVIKASYFGDYEVLYVRYPGLPSPPPSADADILNEGPYPGNGNNSRKIKPLGVDVHKGRQNKLNGGIIAIITLSTFVAVALCSATAWVLLLKHRDRASQPASTPYALQPSLGKASGTAGSMMESRHSSVSLSFGSSIAPYTGSAKIFSARDIERATDNFDPSRILGEGGFGLVYSGVVEDGTKVAVKVLKRDDQQGGREFLAEVEMLSRLHHRNLVKLIGICTEERSRCLVYELIPNGSVESHLHGIDKEAAPLTWGPRMKIALGAARGLAYLHEDSSPRVIHRDFKSSNILLEDDFTPKVSDFGLARTAMDEENRHISTRVMGTFGYVAPEYAMTGHLLVKSDVYSYGVVLLELLTGRKPVDMSQPPGEENLVAWARPLLTSKEGLEAIIDKSLGSDVPFESIAKVAAIASMCVQPEVSHRPFMGEVVQALKLVCNEFDEAKEIGSRSSSHEDLSIDVAAEEGITSGRLPNPFQSQYSAPTYDSEIESDRGASMLKMFSASMRVGRQDSESFRRHSSSGTLGTGRSRRFWERLRRSSGGSVSEHGFMLKLWKGSH